MKAEDFVEQLRELSSSLCPEVEKFKDPAAFALTSADGRAKLLSFDDFVFGLCLFIAANQDYGSIIDSKSSTPHEEKRSSRLNSSQGSRPNSAKPVKKPKPSKRPGSAIQPSADLLVVDPDVLVSLLQVLRSDWTEQDHGLPGPEEEAP